MRSLRALGEVHLPGLMLQIYKAVNPRSDYEQRAIKALLELGHLKDNLPNEWQRKMKTLALEREDIFGETSPHPLKQVMEIETRLIKQVEELVCGEVTTLFVEGVPHKQDVFGNYATKRGINTVHLDEENPHYKTYITLLEEAKTANPLRRIDIERETKEARRDSEDVWVRKMQGHDLGNALLITGINHVIQPRLSALLRYQSVPTELNLLNINDVFLLNGILS